MGKPSITNIKPPSSTTVWVPPKTTWDLNVAADVTAAGTDFATNTGTGLDAYANKVGTINTNEASALDISKQDMVDGYGYVFFGVNGGEDETVYGKSGVGGVIVTGNGKDHVWGGGQGDLIWSGNGADVDHGGAGNDIIFGENGPDQLWGDSDNGSAGFTPGEEGNGVVINDGVDVWDHDPNGEHESATTPNKTTVSKEGIFIALDGDGHPTELDGDGNPVVHVVFSITPDASGHYTIAYTQGNGLDGPGDPSFPGDTDILEVDLTAGNTYYFSFTYDDGHSTIRADVFNGWGLGITGDNHTDPTPEATSQGLPAPDVSTLFHEEGNGPPVFFFNEGDQLIGGNGPDQFVYGMNDTTSVDIVWDYNQGDGTYNSLEGDTVWLVGGSQTDLDNATIITDYDIDGDGNNDLVILFSDNHAIGFVGITNINQISFHFGTPA